LPFDDRWLVENIHDTDFLGQRHAIDFVAVDDRRRTASQRDWRTFVATEPPERFHSFGRPILAPGAGVVTRIHDGEPDHEARRSQLTLVPYALTQPARLRQGIEAVTGNYVTLHLEDGAYATLCHLRRGSLVVRVGDRVAAGEPIAECGNSGNSTQPHLHLQVNDGPDWHTARGLPPTFRDYREWSPDGRVRHRPEGSPKRSTVVAPG